MKKIKSAMDKLYTHGQVAAYSAVQKMKEQQGMSELVVVVILIVIATVAMVILFWPWVQKLLKNLFTNADTKIDSVWNYNG